MEVTPCRVIGYYVTEKKNAKMNWSEFNNVCRNHGFSLVKINLQESLEAQGPFFAIIHKISDVIVKSSMGDSEATAALNNMESYIKLHPEVIVVDPLAGVRSLVDRSLYYRIVQDSDLAQDQVFMPTFVDLTSTDLSENLKRLKDAGITYPFDNETIFFSTSDVSKADSTSSLTVLDPEDLAAAPSSKPDSDRLKHIVSSLRKELGMMLFGVDVVIEHGSGRYGIIDINIFPGYDGFPNFFQTLMDNILDTASTKNFGSLKKSRRMSDETEDSCSARKYEKLRHPKTNHLEAPPLFPKRGTLSTVVNMENPTIREYEQDDSGFDTGDSSDERKKKWGVAGGRGGYTRKVAQQARGFSTSVQPSLNNSCENSMRGGLSGV
ncbi:inositol-tetrakisphosphate 1-kinase-like isoform X2 [Thrips palmi]|uniref:Inositol-tetrakisphosphate 1-kinase-like isoform X2 n=1 Tax=Thrips palmi TaxID=161013 RepID=A0A6P8YKJ6_THRPL|nr:inositol-tetrakisphosphate 1-kinase-like isoform X2 [Thrips palmi]